MSYRWTSGFLALLLLLPIFDAAATSAHDDRAPDWNTQAIPPTTH